MRKRSRPRVALAWWGSVIGGGPTIGDLLALQATHTALTQHGFECHVISDACYKGQVTPFSTVAAENWDIYDALVWVCGPLIAGSRGFVEIFQRFQGRPRIAAGVSVLPVGVADHFADFDVCIARDGTKGAIGDIALAAPLSVMPEHCMRQGLGICLRGPQREYGVNRCEHLKTEALAVTALKATGLAPTLLETRLDRSLSSASLLEMRFGTPHLVISSRLHGALLALRHGTPVVAIDQINGGGKVSEVLIRLGWPWVYRADEVHSQEIDDAVRHLLEEDVSQLILSCREAAEREARSALGTLCTALTTVLKQ